MTPSEIIEHDFTSYLEEQRGLAASTVINYVAGARALLGSRFGSGPVRLARLNAAQITDFVTDYARRQGATATQTMATALRSFLRVARRLVELALRGEAADNISAIVLAAENDRAPTRRRRSSRGQVRQRGKVRRSAAVALTESSAGSTPAAGTAGWRDG